ncbi:MAG: HlyD family type I secretion periplasmic adaptor subunit [Campylobacterales bacterium]|nr:HlyD family type I secretion periplasmic adaptor subunit [Campylobacterales bacterium]
MSYHYLESQHWNHRLVTLPIGLFTLAFFTWAALAHIDEAVKGAGKVIPSGQTRVLQHFEGGIISDILVSEGEPVDEGQILYRIQNQHFSSEHKENTIKRLAAQARFHRIQALLENKSAPVFDAKAIEEIAQIIENESHIFIEERKKHASELLVLENQLNQKRARLKELEARLENLSLEYALASENMKIQEELNAKGVISRERYLQHFSTKQRLYTQLEEARFAIPVVKRELEEWSQKIEGKTFEIRSKLLQELNDVSLELKRLEEIIEAQVDRDTRTGLASPVKGVINKLHFHTIGGVVRPGDTLAEISPLEEEMMIEAKIQVSDRAYIHAGQNVSIEITAYEFSRYGLIGGKLVGISPDSTTDEQGNSHYLVRIKANNYQFDENSPVLVGMGANISILTGKRTVLHYLLKPMKDLNYKALKEH